LLKKKKKFDTACFFIEYFFGGSFQDQFNICKYKNYEIDLISLSKNLYIFLLMRMLHFKSAILVRDTFGL